MIDMTFTCPKCGGHHFGSSQGRKAGDPMKRHCHSIVKFQSGRVSNCTFSFPETEDWKYFKIPGVRAFKNAEEYQLIMELIRSRPAYGIGQLVL